LSGDIPNNAANTSGNAATATAISTTGANGTYWGVSGGVQGYYTPTGSGTVNSGLTGQLAYYPANGTAISGEAVPTWNQNTTGNAATATNPASAPTQCTSGLFATGVSASAWAANCAQVAFSQLSGSLAHGQLPTLLSGDIPNNAANTTGNAATATALSTTGSNGTYWGVSGGVQGYYTPSGSGSGTVSGQAANVIPLGTSAAAISNQSYLSQNASDGSILGSKAIDWASCSTASTTGTVTVDFSASNCAIVTATGGNVTLAVSNPHGAGPYALRLCSDSTLRTFTLAGSLLNVGVPYAASTCYETTGILYDGTNYDGPGSTETPSTLRFSATRSAVANPSGSAGGAAWIDSTDLDFEYQNGGAAPFKMFLSGQDCNPVTGICTTSNGVAIATTTGTQTLTNKTLTAPILSGASGTTCLQQVSGVITATGSACGSGSGGDTITSPNATMTVGGTSTNTTIDEVANTYWSPFPFGNSSAPPTSASNTVQGIGFMVPTPVTFANINVQSDVADASGEYSVAIANSSGTLICHPTTAQHMGTAHTIMTYACNEGTVTLYPGNVYIFLGTGNATTGLLVAATATQFIVPFYSSSISGFSSSGGLITGTGTGITLAVAVPASGVPEFILH